VTSRKVAKVASQNKRKQTIPILALRQIFPLFLLACWRQWSRHLRS